MPTLVKLVPPRLDSSTIFKKVTGCRPMREGKFNISQEISGNKCLVHCYGHGGSGFTTLFGSVKRAIDLLVNAKVRGKIRVIGAGCMGLTAAIELSRMGYDVRITAKDLYDITSYRAAGCFAIISVRTSPAEQQNLIEIGADSFEVYWQIARGEHPYLSTEFLRLMPMFCNSKFESGLESLVEKGAVPPPEEVCLDFGQGAFYENFLQYMTFFIDTTRMMRQLHDEVKRRGIPIEFAKVESFDEIEEDVLINCTGLGAKALMKDESLISVRGHLLLLNSEAGTRHMDYLINTTVLHEEKEEYIYLFPKTEMVSSVCPEGSPCQGVLGGSFIQHDDRLSPSELAELDQREFQKIFDRSSLFFTGKLTNIA
jgi:D-amino-acid oxidase